MIAENDNPDAEQSDEQDSALAELARTMLADGFTKPIVIDALVAEGVQREEAIAIVNRLLKARFRATQAKQQVVHQSKAWGWMALGVAIMGVGLFFMAEYYLLEGEFLLKRRFFVRRWAIMMAGFFTFLFGYTRKKRP